MDLSTLSDAQTTDFTVDPTFQQLVSNSLIGLCLLAKGVTIMIPGCFRRVRKAIVDDCGLIQFVACRFSLFFLHTHTEIDR